MEATLQAHKKFNKRQLLKNQYLFLTFSLLPGFGKVFDNQLFFLLNIPLLIVFFYVNFKHETSLKKIDAVFYCFLAICILQTIVSVFMPYVNQLGLYMGFYMSILPMIGYLMAKKVCIDDFYKILMFVCLIHCIIGILIYPMFGLGGFLGDITTKLRAGTGYIRMGSVSGSLGFANLALVGFITSLAKNKRFYSALFFFCIICSMQRSAWLAAIFAILLVNVFFLSKKALINITLVFILAIFSLPFLEKLQFLDTLGERIGQVGSNAADERSSQWIGGLQNFAKYPLGSGVGQVGQVGSRYERNLNFNAVPDGDYFRILSEYGLAGLMFYVIFFCLLGLSILNLKNFSRQNKFIVIMLIGYSIQMLGSNITEFYFTNVIYWMFIGYYFKNFNLNLKNEWR